MDIAIFAAKISYLFFQKLNRPAKSSYVNWHRENLQLDRENTGKHSEIENTIRVGTLKCHPRGTAI